MAGACGYGNSYFDQVTVGNGGCSYQAQDCIEMSLTGNCWGFSAGDVVGVQYNTSGSNVTIDILP
jgi:hypothetical protein